MLLLATRGRHLLKVFFSFQWLVQTDCGAKLTSSVGLLYELWPTAPPQPVCFSSAHVSQCLSVKQSPSDRQDCHSVLVAEPLGLQFVVRSCVRHCQLCLERVSLLCPLRLAGLTSLGPLIHTSPHLHEPVGYRYLDIPLCLSYEGFLIGMISGWWGHDWSVGLHAAQPSLACPPLCEKGNTRWSNITAKLKSVCEISLSVHWSV